jgi:hypothetical protein
MHFCVTIRVLSDVHRLVCVYGTWHRVVLLQFCCHVTGVCCVLQPGGGGAGVRASALLLPAAHQAARRCWRDLRVAAIVIADNHCALRTLALLGVAEKSCCCSANSNELVCQQTPTL